MPGYTLHGLQLNAGGTLLNWIGSFLDGLSYGYEDKMKGAEVSLVCTQFRSAFLGYESGETCGPLLDTMLDL